MSFSRPLKFDLSSNDVIRKARMTGYRETSLSKGASEKIHAPTIVGDVKSAL